MHAHTARTLTQVTHTVLATPEVLRAVGGSTATPATTTTTATKAASSAATTSTLEALEALNHVPSATRDASGSCPEAAAAAAKLEEEAAAAAVSPFRSAICNLLLFFADTYRKVC